jgi:hypothetical protein
MAVLLTLRVPEKVDAAPRENRGQKEERSQRDDKLGRNVQSSPIGIDWFSAQDLPISVSDGKESDQREGQAFSPSQILTFGFLHSPAESAIPQSTQF